MNTFVISCISGSILIYLTALSYHMYYAREAIYAFQKEKIQFYETEALLAYGVELYKKNITEPALQRSVSGAFLGKQAPGSVCISQISSDQVKITAQILDKNLSGKKVHSCVITRNTLLHRSTITDWRVGH